MTAVIGLDDTDSRERGMCTTYVAARIAARLCEERRDCVERLVLVRLNPAVEHKTRGNAALAIHADCDPDLAFDVARSFVDSLAETADPNTNPGLVVAPHDPDDVPASIAAFARHALWDHHEVVAASRAIDAHDYRAEGWGNARGTIGALAAIGAWSALDDWTYEYISYREPDRWGTPREVDRESVFDAADRFYPRTWDTVDRGEDETVCVPHTPGPILHGIRGDDADAVCQLAERIDGEPVADAQLFVTNQGTDAHVRDGTIDATDDGLDAVRDGRAYRVTGRVVDPPDTRRGGHVFLAIGDGQEHLSCAAFEPTKRFRDRVRALRVGDRITVCGEVSEGTLKLEKFAVRELVTTTEATPRCPDCDRSMESAGRGQGYRCRDCGTTADGRVERPIERDLEMGWYEVPPCARRHVAKPLVRGGFDTPVHPER